ncbi:MAG: hypothetical protein Q8933_06130 [Bacteroidota bacterium]|nr:hypothetical protein [Bacteroidota bacterium]MDP4190747.1 hypothetical protein [Bacteroidota bacterium]MDP4194671.1 hypothetical protein [Bacteroidota bacterium]
MSLLNEEPESQSLEKKCQNILQIAEKLQYIRFVVDNGIKLIFGDQMITIKESDFLNEVNSELTCEKTLESAIRSVVFNNLRDKI